MSLSDNYQVDVSTGNGVTTVYTGSWSPLVASYMKVALKTIATGVIANPLTQGAGAGEYTLSFTSSGYTVTLGTAPSSAFQVLRYREVAQDQTTPYTTAKGFQGAVIENSFDKLTAIGQDTRDLVGRQFSVPIGDTATSLEFPAESIRALKYAAFDASGNPTVTEGTDASVPISAAMAPVVSAASLSAARTAMGVAASGANSDITSLTGITTPFSLPQDFRLSLTTAVPVTTADVTGATTIFCVPYRGNLIALYNGSNWVTRSSAQFSLALGTLTSGKPYDVFCYDNAGVPTLEFLVWTNDTTRATALVYQDGVLVKSGATTRRYMGTFYTTATTTTEDSLANRYLWNYYNRVLRAMQRLEGTASWTYTTAAFRQANASTSNQLNYIAGVAENSVSAQVNGMVSNSSPSVNAVVGIGVDSTTTATGPTGMIGLPSNGVVMGGSISYNGIPGVGRHFLVWLEYATATGTATWIGVNGVNQTGITGTVLG